VGEAAYQLVVLPSMLSLESAAWRKLEEFVSDGGTVIACGSLPEEEIELDADVVQRCATAFARNGRGFRRVSGPHLVATLDELLPADLRITPPSRDVLVAHRRDDDEDLFLIANSGPSPLSCEVSLNGSVARYDLETGTREPLDATGGVVRLDFASYGCYLIGVGGPPTSALVDAAPVDELCMDLDGEWRCEVSGDNILRLDRFDFSMQSSWEAAVSVTPKPLINLLQDVTSVGQPWPGELSVPPIFGAPPRIQLKLPGAARYRTSFAVEELPSRALLCLEEASLSGEWAISLNGTPVTHFTRRRRWDTGNREADILSLLQVGTNELQVTVNAQESSDGLLDALHMLGDFGVFFDERDRPILRKLPTSIHWSDRHTSGFPNYAGTFQLSRASSLPEVARPTRLRLPDAELMFAGVAELRVDGQSLGVRAWAPFAWTLPAGSAGPLELSITNTLVEALEGRRYDPVTRQAIAVR
jgi:hypothetical protein